MILTELNPFLELLEDTKYSTFKKSRAKYNKNLLLKKVEQNIIKIYF